jgi:hypothetical protein
MNYKNLIKAFIIFSLVNCSLNIYIGACETNLVIVDEVVADQELIFEDMLIPRQIKTVELDGLITSSEWSDAAFHSLYLIFYNATSDEEVTRDAEFYIKHDCENVWVAVRYENPVETLTVDPIEGDGLYLVIFYDPYDLPLDGKFVYHPNLPVDLIEKSGYSGNDEDFGGSNDVGAKTSWENGWLSVELTFPIVSEDIENDIPLSFDEEMGMVFVGVDVDMPGDSGGYPSGDGVNMLIFNIILERCPSVGGEAFLISNTRSGTGNKIPHMIILLIVPVILLMYKRNSKYIIK